MNKCLHCNRPHVTEADADALLNSLRPHIIVRGDRLPALTRAIWDVFEALTGKTDPFDAPRCDPPISK